MPSRSRVFNGSSDLTSRFASATQPSLYFLREGEYVGAQFFTNETVRFNPQGLIADRKLHSGNIGVAAEKIHGKGVLMKSFAVMLGGMKAGKSDNGEFVRPRQRVNDNKLEGGAGEWGEVTKFKLREPIYLAGQGRISPFDKRMNMTTVQQMEQLSFMLEDAKGSSLDPTESYVAQMVVFLINNDGNAPTLEWIAKLAHGIAPEAVMEYTQYFNAQLKNQYAAELVTNEKFRKRFEAVMARDEKNYIGEQSEDFRRIKQAGIRVFELVNVLLGGTYGQTFGGTRSLYDLLTDSYVHFDWTNMAPRAAALLEAVLKYWEAVGARKDSGNHLVVPHYVFHDEQGSEMTKSLAHATLRAEENRKARAVQTVHFDMYQNFDDLLKLGNPNTSFRAQGEVMHRGIAAWFIGRQSDDEANLHAMTRRGATDEEAYWTTKLGSGTWGFLVPGSGKPMEFFSHLLLPKIAPLVDTTKAATQAAER